MTTGEPDLVGMTDINRLKNEARRQEQREQWPLAIELYSKAIDAIEAQGYGTDLSLYNRVGDLYLRQGETARAVSFYERAVDRYAEQGLQTSAVALCNKVLRIAPGRSEIYRILGRLHAETGLQTQARRSFMEYASRMEDAGDLDAAVEALDEFVKLSADEEARTSLGRYLIELGRIPEGVAHLRQVLAERSDRGEESSEIEALIEQVAPDEVTPDDTDSGLGESDDHVNAEPEAPAPALSDVDAAELDQIIADLGDLTLDDESDALADVPSDALADVPFVPSSGSEPAVTALGTADSVTDSRLHDLLSEFQDRVVATVRETDSVVHYELGVAYKEMGLLDDAIREFTTAIQNDVPDTDVSDQMERMSELLRASPSDETLTELKQLLRAITDPASATGQNGSAAFVGLDGIPVDELFPDLEEAWESTSEEAGTDLTGIEAIDESRPEGSPDDDGEAIETEAAFAAPAEVDGEVTGEEVSELEAAATEVEIEDAPPPDDEEVGDADVETLTASDEPGAELEPVDTPESPSEWEEEDLAESDQDGSALEALSEALAEPVETWDDPEEFQPTWDPDALTDEGAEARSDWETEPTWDVEAGIEPQDPEETDEDAEIEFEADVSDEELPDTVLEADVLDEELPEIELEADVLDEELPDTELEADVPAEEQPEDLGGLLFGARLATFRARMARSASETDFQAHYDLGLAYKEVALFDEAIAELLVAITGPDSMARKALRLMSEVAELADDESLHFTTAEHLHQHGMSAEALEHLSHVYESRLTTGGDTDDVLRRMSAIDPQFVPASAPDAEPSAQAVDSAQEHTAPDAGDLALVAEGFDSILDELNVPEPAVDDEPEAADASAEPQGSEAPQNDDLTAWELRTAELLEDGHRDEAIRELYRLQSAYEMQADLPGAMRAVSNLLLLDPEDVILHHQQVEYAIMLDDHSVITNARLELGHCLARQGATSNARSTFEQVLEIDSENAPARAAMAELDLLDDDVEERNGPQPFVGDDPVHYETHYELGVAFKQDGLHDEAVYELEIAATGLEDPIPAYELLGELFNDAGQHDTTLKVLERALEANGHGDSELVGVLYQLGVSHQELGDTDQAAECFRRVLEVASDYRDAEHRLNECAL